VEAQLNDEARLALAATSITDAAERFHRRNAPARFEAGSRAAAHSWRRERQPSLRRRAMSRKLKPVLPGETVAVVLTRVGGDVVQPGLCGGVNSPVAAAWIQRSLPANGIPA
jgi:hypothetical protein